MTCPGLLIPSKVLTISRVGHTEWQSISFCELLSLVKTADSNALSCKHFPASIYVIVSRDLQVGAPYRLLLKPITISVYWHLSQLTLQESTAISQLLCNGCIRMILVSWRVNGLTSSRTWTEFCPAIYLDIYIYIYIYTWTPHHRACES